MSDITVDEHPTQLPDVDRSWDNTWPVELAELKYLVVAFVAVVATGAAVGLTLTDWAAPNAVTRLDDRVANWFVDGRTDALNSLAPWAAGPADTFIKIGISTVICGVLLWMFRRWDEAVYVALPLVFEATCFITITHIVGRPRPDVERLLESTVNSSFPSGHVAAATVYFAVVIVVWRHTGAVWARALSLGIFLVIEIGVIWARLYQGMHYLSDVTAGVVLGAVSLLITDRILTTRMGTFSHPGDAAAAASSRRSAVDAPADRPSPH
ncbi:MAG: hypothetical protein CL424_02215 [Acidimicrobiaceae bacterium]|nr:hypothetical protein [Acidimicrobiaceae bacterium]